MIDVFGFLTINEGIKVHKKNCPNALSLQSNYAYRIMGAKWIDSSQQEFTAVIQMTGIDNLGTGKRYHQNHFGQYACKYDQASVLILMVAHFLVRITVVVKNKNEVTKLIDKLKKINGIEKVTSANKI